MSDTELDNRIRDIKALAGIDDQDEDEETRKLESGLKHSLRKRIARMLGWDLRPLYVPALFHKKKSFGASGEEAFELNMFERFFVCLNDPDSCIIASVLSTVFLSIILLNIINGIVLTIPRYRSSPIYSCPGREACSKNPDICPNVIECEPGEDATLVAIDGACVIVFTIEYGLRALLAWFIKAKNVRLLQIVSKQWHIDEHERVMRSGSMEPPRLQPDFSFWYPPLSYLSLTKNVIDVLSIVPYYIELAGSGGASVSFVRVLRLLRILRAFKLRGGGVMKVMIRSLKDSIEPLMLLMLSATLVVLVFGSIAFTLEGGDFFYRCDWDTGLDGTLGFVDGVPNDGAFCRGGYLRPNLAGSTIEQTPFLSTLSGMYWASITMTTVGYGDLYPTSPGGRVLAVFCALCGLILMALPISILGNNFSQEYRKYKKLLQDERDFRIAQMHRLHDINRKKLEQKKAQSKYMNVINSDKECTMKEYGMETYNAPNADSTVNYFENVAFQFSDENLPRLPLPLNVKDTQIKSHRPKVTKSYEEVLRYENEIMAKANAEEFEKEDVIEMLRETCEKLKLATQAHAKAVHALSKINAGVDNMDHMLAVLRKLQDAQEIAGTVDLN